MADLPKEGEIQEGKFFAIISYISFLCIVVLVLKRDNKFTLYHGKQGLVLFVLEVASFILLKVKIFDAFIKTFGVLIFTLISLWGALQALMGNYNRIPIVSDIADRIFL